MIGAGQVGSTLGKAWQRRGHDISYGVRNPGDPKYAALGATVTTNDQAARAADIVVLCTRWQDTRLAVQVCGDLTGKLLIDCTNPLTSDVTGLTVGHVVSGAEQVAGRCSSVRADSNRSSLVRCSGAMASNSRNPSSVNWMRAAAAIVGVGFAGDSAGFDEPFQPENASPVCLQVRRDAGVVVR